MFRLLDFTFNDRDAKQERIMEPTQKIIIENLKTAIDNVSADCYSIKNPSDQGYTKKNVEPERNFCANLHSCLKEEIKK
jgi:hypothetical protein